MKKKEKHKERGTGKRSRAKRWAGRGNDKRGMTRFNEGERRWNTTKEYDKRENGEKKKKRGREERWNVNAEKCRKKREIN